MCRTCGEMKSLGHICLHNRGFYTCKWGEPGHTSLKDFHSLDIEGMTLDIQYTKLIIIFMVKDYRNAIVKYVNWLMLIYLNINGKKIYISYTITVKTCFKCTVFGKE